MNRQKLLNQIKTFCALAIDAGQPKPSNNLSEITLNLDRIETYSGRKDYAEENLEHLSSGSSRLVYLTPEKTVIKLAKNDRGLAQNQAEANITEKSKFLNKTIGHSKKYVWLETHYLEKITTKDFKKMTGLDFDDFGVSLRWSLKKVSGNSDVEKPKCFDKVAKTEIFKEITKIGIKYKLLSGDLSRISSWGHKDQHPVLLDAGLTSKIYNKFYDTSS